MPGRTYKIRGIVLKKTKLSEKDLIVTMLDESGQLLQAVAKGARKPGGSFAAKLELFSVVDCMLAQGKNIDVVSDARFVGTEGALRLGMEQGICASVVSELVCAIGQQGLSHDRLFDMTAAAFRSFASLDSRRALVVMTADIIKVVSLAGFKPSLDVCVGCGERVDLGRREGRVFFSVVEGGVLCEGCRGSADAVGVNANMLAWCNVLLRSTFADAAQMEIDTPTLFDIMQLERQWVRVHVGKNLKSMDFLMSSGLF